MSGSLITMLENMASHGTAPEEGCSLFGVGYEEAYHRLKHTYLISKFDRGSSAEKFVVGPFGSGKTHFLHQFMELARANQCASSKVTLNKDIDFTQSLVVYKEIVREIRVPNVQGHGIYNVIQGCLELIRSKTEDSAISELLVRSWVSGLEQKDFKLPDFGKVMKVACTALLDDNKEHLDIACRWLNGEIDNRSLCLELNVAPVQKTEFNLVAKRAMLSLFQFIKSAGYRGTVVGYDEAEQGFTVDKKKTERILSMLMAGINSIVELNNGAVLMLYALTPDLIERMDSFAALQQRIADPGQGNGFFDGNVYAPVIDLTKRTDMVKDLYAIGSRLVELMYAQYDQELITPKEQMLEQTESLAKSVAEDDMSSSNRRTMVKRVCTMLLLAYDQAYSETATTNAVEDDEV